MARRSARIKNAVPVKGQWDVLPHGMGVLPTLTSQPMNGTILQDKASEENHAMNNEPGRQVLNTNFIEKKQTYPTTATSSAAVSQQSDESFIKLTNAPEDLSSASTETELDGIVQKTTEDSESIEHAPTLRRSKRIRAQITVDEVQVKVNGGNIATKPSTKRTKQVHKQVKVEGDAIDLSKPLKIKRVPRKTKDNPYGLTPGASPFPDWQAPSFSQCEEVYRILADLHGEVTQPAMIPAPSLEVAGCGEVPFVLEALLRTLLSGAVTFEGADSMVKGIVARYGTVQDDLAKGSIDWNKIRLSTTEELEEAIHVGGLANRKAKAIKGTLDMVYQDNIDRREAYLAEKETGIPATVYGASEKTQGQKDLEILKTERHILSLDHLHGLSADEAMRQFTKFPGIGVKTSACVILFCLQRPCFAVDTHVHRFSRWLGWAPPKADENDTFSHLEVRCPDHLKYGLHQLFIRHGKYCGRCKMSTVEGTKEWEAVICPLEHLLVRGKKMTKVQKKTKGKGKKEDFPDETDSALSDVDSAIFEDDVLEV
ncbi:DNA glycosylase [Nemania sp. FL0916]|nr:DNA glycosylase [Nemania sp. FL0916]